MADKVGEAEYELDLDTSEFKLKATEAGNHLKTVISVAAGIEFQRLANEFRQLGSELFNLVADFDHFIITLGSQGQVAQKHAQDVAQAMLDLSRQTLFGASEIVVAVAGIAQRLETLTGREVNVADATAFMTAATNLAVASSSDLTSATSTLINVMLAYEIPLSDVARATDLVFNLSRITGVEFITLALAADRLKARLGDAAPSLADVGTVLATVNELGITGSRGLLVLVSGIEALTEGGKEVTNELNRLGVGIYDAQGRFVGFRSIIDQLSKAYANLTPQQKNLSADILFSSQASTILLGIIDKGVETYDEFTKRITTSGTASQGATQHVADLNGQLTILKNNILATAIELGNKLEPAITKLISLVNPLLQGLSKNEDAMIAVAVVAAGILVSSLILVTLAFSAVAGAAIVAFIAVNAMLLGIPIAVAVAVAAIVLLIHNWEEVTDVFKESLHGWLLAWEALWSKIPDVAQDAIEAVIAPAKQMSKDIMDTFPQIADAWEALWDSMPQFVKNAEGPIISAAQSIADKIVNIWNKIKNPSLGAEGLSGDIRDVEIRDSITGEPYFITRQEAKDLLNLPEAPGSQFTGAERDRLKREMEKAEAAGSPVVPDFIPDKEKAPKALSQLQKDLLALAAAWAIFHQQTGGNLNDFQVFLKLQEANLNLKQREHDAMIALNTSTMLLTNRSFQLRLTFVQLAEEAARSGRSIQAVVFDLFEGIADKAKSFLDEILNAPTRESTQMQLNIDKLRRQALLLERGGADASRVDNIGKPGTPQPNAADRELNRIENRIKALELEQRIRQANIDIMKSEAILKQQNLQTEADIANAHVFLGQQIFNLTGTVRDLDDAMGGLLARLGVQLGIPQLYTGLSFVPQKMVAILDPGEAVLTAQQNSERNFRTPNGPAAAFSFHFSGTDFDSMKQEMNQKYDKAVWAIRRRGTSIPKGTFSGR